MASPGFRQNSGQGGSFGFWDKIKGAWDKITDGGVEGGVTVENGRVTGGVDAELGPIDVRLKFGSGGKQDPAQNPERDPTTGDIVSGGGLAASGYTGYGWLLPVAVVVGFFLWSR